MTRILKIILFILAVNPSVWCQQTNRWYFGDHAGLNFNNTPPTPLLDGQMSTNEGCGVVSDSLGNLQFYTDGMTVWNKNHQVMPNGTGLMGHWSSTHSAMVIPKPGSSFIYYIFTSDATDNFGAAGYRYSEVDMTLNGGLGDITSNKNILLYAPCTEKLASASHANGIDIWVISKERDNHTFRTYKVTCNGVENNPVISNVDPVNGSVLGYNAGCIKVSQDGTKIASARNFEGKWDLFRFDNATGIISDRKMITQSSQIGIYGVEFSPNSQIVYLNGSYTYQYKIDVYDSTIISNSKYQVDTVFIFRGALQMGPDGKIYSNTHPNLSVIANSNVYGAGCNYQEQTVSLGGRDPLAGFPTFFNRLVTNNNLDYTYTVQPNCQSVNFSGTTTIPGPLTWNWDFGDGTTGSGQNVNHVFPPTPNQFTVTLTVTNSAVCGGTATRSKMITFDRVAPTADFNFTAICGNRTVSFQNLSTIPPPGVITSYLWDFGDGNTSTQQNPGHTYALFGSYTVTLTAFSGDACNSMNVRTETVVVPPNPIATFSVSDTCYTQAMLFTNNSSVSYGSITSYLWNFGDGNTSTQQSPAHTYNSPGTYNVTLTVTSDNNCTASTLPLPVKAGAKPLVDFNLPAVCLLDATAAFTNNSSSPDGTPVTYWWKFGDPFATPPNPDTSVLINPTHSYSAAAVYIVRLRVSSSLGCKDSLSKAFTVNGAVPRANFTFLNSSSQCVTDDVFIKDSSYVDFGNITKVEVDWGDGNVITDNVPGQMPNGHIYTHRYASFSNPAIRNFTITMRSWSGGVCIDTRTKQVTVNASPEISFSPIPDVCNEAPPFNITQASALWGIPGSGSYSGMGITNGPAGTFNPGLVTAGNHSITYIFISNAGCRTDSSKNIIVNPTPIADFTFDYGCLPTAQIHFTSNSSVQGGSTGTLQHSWDFGDPFANTGNPNTSTSINPSHSYSSLDSFIVQLQVISLKGCMHDTTIKLYPNLSIFPQPVADFTIDSSHAICQGSPVYFINQSNNGGQPVAQYQWNFNNSATSGQQNPVHIFPSYGPYDVTLMIENIKGCKSVAKTRNIIVHSVPTAEFVFDSTCFGKPIQFFDRSNNVLGAITNWSWDLGNGSNSNLQYPTTTYLQYRTYTITLQVSTINKCLSTPVSKSFSIKKVIVNAGRDTSITRNQPLQLQASGASQYTWSPPNGLSNPGIPNPVAIINNANYQSYYLKGITTEGCIGYDTINIKIFEKADIYVPSAFTPNHDGLNDYLRPICVGIRQLNYFRIYDRWGNIIHASRSEYDRWDGTLKGAQLNPGNFVWMAEGVTYDGRVIQRKGNIILIR